MKKITLLSTIFILTFNAGLSFANDMGNTIEATTANGDKVLLKPNGRWEFIDPEKAKKAEKIAKQYPENNVCPPGSQGGWFGTKCILPGDPGFNRKSRIGK
jgi:hypothetical protein